jgi:hypothetical protein
MTALEGELDACGGAGAPATATARLKQVLAKALEHGREELGRPRSGTHDNPVEIGIAQHDGHLLAATPAAAALRADPQVATGREWLLVAATVGTLIELAGAQAPRGPKDLKLQAGELPGGFLVLGYPSGEFDSELVALAFEDHAHAIDRLKAHALALPQNIIDDVPLKEPIGAGHPLRVAEALARLGKNPADPQDVEANEDALYALLGRGDQSTRPHEDPDPGKRVARRILQRLDGMGKWGGYHTEFAHLARGFAGNDRGLAQEVGEALLQAGLLEEKPSVGQRHVYLNSRKAAEIRRMIDTGELPSGMKLPTR